jgi:hypothetical protein
MARMQVPVTSLYRGYFPEVATTNRRSRRGREEVLAAPVLFAVRCGGGGGADAPVPPISGGRGHGIEGCHDGLV